MLPTGFPLARGNLVALWIPFKFKRLGNFCYECGLLGHDVKSRLDAEVQLLWKKGITFGIHGNWLRTKVSEYQPGINLEGLRSVDMVECDQRAVKVPRDANILESQAGPSRPSRVKAVQLTLNNWKELK